MQPPLLTIAISTYNRADGYLREAYTSALAQTYAPLEIVVVDNASTDSTADLIASLADERVRYVRNDTNIGPNGNFNACLAQARGSYFLLLHDDDRIDEDLAAYAMGALMQPHAPSTPGLIRTGVRVMDAEGQVFDERPNEGTGVSVATVARDWFQGRTPMYFCNTVFHTEALREAGGFRSPRELYIDVAAVFRIAARHPVLELPEVKASFRRHGGNNGGAQSIQAWCDDAKYLLDLLGELDPSQADELRSLGTKYFISNSYTRASRLRDPIQRMRAYWTVYRSFGYRHSPLRYVAYRSYQQFRRGHGGASL